MDFMLFSTVCLKKLFYEASKLYGKGSYSAKSHLDGNSLLILICWCNIFFLHQVFLLVVHYHIVKQGVYVSLVYCFYCDYLVSLAKNAENNLLFPPWSSLVLKYSSAWFKLWIQIKFRSFEDVASTIWINYVTTPRGKMFCEWLYFRATLR